MRRVVDGPVWTWWVVIGGESLSVHWRKERVYSKRGYRHRQGIVRALIERLNITSWIQRSEHGLSLAEYRFHDAVAHAPSTNSEVSICHHESALPTKSTSLGCLLLNLPPRPLSPYPFDRPWFCCCSSGPSLANLSRSDLTVVKTLSRLLLQTISLPWISCHCFSPNTLYVARCTRNSCFS